MFVKMRALRSFSSMVWGSREPGDLFDVHVGYVKQLTEAGVAVPVSADPAPDPVKPPTRAVVVEDETPAPIEAPRRRGRRSRLSLS